MIRGVGVQLAFVQPMHWFLLSNHVDDGGEMVCWERNFVLTQSNGGSRPFMQTDLF